MIICIPILHTIYLGWQKICPGKFGLAFARESMRGWVGIMLAMTIGICSV